MKKIELTQDKFALVDDDDYDFLNQFKWSAAKTYKTFYAVKRNGKKMISMHNMIMGTIKGKIIDHIDGDGLNNVRKNLRHATHSENMQNRRSCGKSKYLGVTLYCVKKRWKYYKTGISKDNNWIYLGSFKSEEKAARVYDNAARLYFGKNAKTNFK